MRIEQFMKSFCSTDLATAYRLASGIEPEKNIDFKKIGGWEVWMQVELAKGLIREESIDKIEREKQYPGHQIRCDLYAERSVGQRLKVYIELKCINYKTQNPQERVLDGFVADCQKLKARLPQYEIGIAACVTYDSPAHIGRYLISKGTVLGNVAVGVFDENGVGLDKLNLNENLEQTENKAMVLAISIP